MVMGGWLFGHSGEHSGRDRGLDCGSFLGVNFFFLGFVMVEIVT